MQDHAQHVKAYQNDHGARSPVVEAANQPSRWNLRSDKLDAVIGMIGGWDIVYGQQDSGDNLGDPNK
jgi:hypothetical protein